MTDEQALLAAIVENPEDDLPRLVYADFIQERGQTERAEFSKCKSRREDKNIFVFFH